MPEFPEVQRLVDAVQKLAGVRRAWIGIRRIDGIGEQELSLPGEVGDLPHLAIRRTKGGLKDEFLVTVTVWFEQDFRGWIALEFLAWWTRDLSRGGVWAQMRPLALPPVGYGTQLGRTLKFAIEFFFINSGADNSPILKKLSDLTKSLEDACRVYAPVLARPTQANPQDIAALQQCADAGDGSAQLELAFCYANGEGVGLDKSTAFLWHERAASHGHPMALMYLGRCYAHGDGTAPDPVRAASYYRRSAEAGEPMAMGLLAECLEDGVGVEKNDAEAVLWYRRGAEAGELACLAQLGECYELGKGVERDLSKAMQFYREARLQGFDAVQPAIERVEAALR